MKKTLILLAFVFMASLTYGQKGRVYSVAVDSLNGAETVNFTLSKITGSYSSVSIQALCTELGGTSDGTLILQGSVDGISYITMTDATGVLQSYPNDTLTITDGAVVQWVVKDNPFNYYRAQGGGTASDSTLVTVKYTYK